MPLAPEGIEADFAPAGFDLFKDDSDRTRLVLRRVPDLELHAVEPDALVVHAILAARARWRDPAYVVLLEVRTAREVNALLDSHDQGSAEAQPQRSSTESITEGNV